MLWQGARKEIINLPIYSPGKRPDQMKGSEGKVFIKLSSNESTIGPSPAAISAASKALSDVHEYPDGASIKLREALAEKLGFSAENIIVSNGADEAIDFMAYAFVNPKDRIMTVRPSFSSYALAAATMGASIVQVEHERLEVFPMEGIEEALREECKIIFISSPNNPTGIKIGIDEMLHLANTVPDSTLLAFDEAYIEFSDDRESSALELVRERENVIVFRTFSKIYGLAGLRIGYAVSSFPVIRSLEKVKLPFNVSGVAQEAALAALRDEDHMESVRVEIIEQRKLLEKSLIDCKIEFVESQGNFVLIRNPHERNLYDLLLKEGIIVRDGAPLDCPGWIRATVGHEEHNRALISALRRISADWN